MLSSVALAAPGAPAPRGQLQTAMALRHGRGRARRVSHPGDRGDSASPLIGTMTHSRRRAQRRSERGARKARREFLEELSGLRVEIRLRALGLLRVLGSGVRRKRGLELTQ